MTPINGSLMNNNKKGIISVSECRAEIELRMQLILNPQGGSRDLNFDTQMLLFRYVFNAQYMTRVSI